MKSMQITFLILLIALSLFGYASDNPLKVSQQAQVSLDGLKQWDNQVIRKTLQVRITENQALINFVSTSNLNDITTEHDADYNEYFLSLLKDQATLARLSKSLLSYSQSQDLDFDGMLHQRPLFRRHLKRELNEILDRQSGNRLLNKMLYFSLQDKYAQR